MRPGRGRAQLPSTKVGVSKREKASAAPARLASVLRALLPGARGTRFASEAAAPLPVFICLSGVPYGS